MAGPVGLLYLRKASLRLKITHSLIEEYGQSHAFILGRLSQHQ